ncbi:hypothetical protein BJV82DRAFT_607113 [Fennellomyces sp. T-0311]|nr:hypothetical protein BJV82DRAFT_607113 [Fennellomyces sp. T-0311]
MIIDEIQRAIVHRDYSRAIEMASTAFESHQQLWPSILDCRAYALAMQGNFGDAVTDAQDIIANEPTIARGYIRLGRIYEMQGKQLDAIDIYNVGLQSVPTRSRDYSLIKNGKATATRRNKRRVDFISRLPVKITDEIITRLPEESKLLCLRGVSPVWSRIFFQCAKAWRNMIITDASSSVTWCVPRHKITASVENLTLDTFSVGTWKTYMVALRNGRFERIKTLCLIPTSAKVMNMHTVMLATNALYQINSTLTTLVLHHNAKRVTFILAELLFALSNLKRLEYTTTQPLADVIGQFPPSKTHDALLDMRLKSPSIEGTAVAPLLRYCRKLRVLVLNVCDDTILDFVNSACPVLEIFACNSDDLVLPAVDHSADTSSTTGLQEFYTRKKVRPESATAVLPFLRRNSVSLKKISIEIFDRGSEDLDTIYTDLKLESLEDLTLWRGDTSRFQSLILRSISNTLSLTHLSVMGSYNMSELLNTLNAMPQIRFLELAYIWDIADSTSLVRLFETYAARSPQYSRTCESIKLKCSHITDEVIIALANVSTLKSVTLENLRSSISPGAVDSFFSSLVRNSVAHVSLGEMDCITDKHISGLGDIRGLESLHLDNLKNITDSCIIAMADKKPALQRFTVTNCDRVTGKAFTHARKNLKYTVIKFNCQ